MNNILMIELKYSPVLSCQIRSVSKISLSVLGCMRQLATATMLSKHLTKIFTANATNVAPGPGDEFYFIQNQLIVSGEMFAGRVKVSSVQGALRQL